MIDFRDAVSKVERSVYGIGDHVEHQICVNGTGFVIHEDGWILTNRHVLEPLLKTDADGYTSIRPDARVLNFVTLNHDGATYPQIGWANTRITELTWINDLPPSNPVSARDEVYFGNQKSDLVLPPATPDIGVCKMDLSPPPFDTIPLKPVKMALSVDLEVGTPVATLGFPQGLRGPEVRSVEELQCCPILQAGCIAAVFPHPELPNPTKLVLDIYISGGSSGSPLFTASGDVVGVVFASRHQMTEVYQLSKGKGPERIPNVGVSIGTSLGYAVPISAFAEQLNKLFPGLIDIPEDHSATEE